MKTKSQFMLHVVALALVGLCLADATTTENTAEITDVGNSEQCAYLKYHPDYVPDQNVHVSENYDTSNVKSESVKKIASLKNGIRRLFVPKDNKVESQTSGGFFKKLLGKGYKAESVDGDSIYNTDDETDDERPVIPDYTESDTFGFDFSADVDFSVEDPQDMKDYFEKEYYDKQKESDDKYYNYIDILDEVAKYKGDDDYDDLELEEQEVGQEAMFDLNQVQEEDEGTKIVKVQSSMPNASDVNSFVQFPDKEINASKPSQLSSEEDSSEDTPNSKIRIIGEPNNLIPTVRKVRTAGLQSGNMHNSEDEANGSDVEEDDSDTHGDDDLGVATRISVGAPQTGPRTSSFAPQPSATPRDPRNPQAPLATQGFQRPRAPQKAPLSITKATLMPTGRFNRVRPPIARKPGTTTTTTTATKKANFTRVQNNSKSYPYLFFKDSLSEKLRSSYAALLIVPIVVIGLL